MFILFAIFTDQVTETLPFSSFLMPDLVGQIWMPAVARVATVQARR